MLNPQIALRHACLINNAPQTSSMGCVRESISSTYLSLSFMPSVDNGYIEPNSLDVGMGFSPMDDAGDPVMSTEADVPNLSGQISILKRKAVFVGTYSKVYIGMYGTQKVIYANHSRRIFSRFTPQVAVKILQPVKNDRVTKRVGTLFCKRDSSNASLSRSSDGSFSSRGAFVIPT
jgi:hypothetical protein